VKSTRKGSSLALKGERALAEPFGALEKRGLPVFGFGLLQETAPFKLPAKGKNLKPGKGRAQYIKGEEQRTNHLALPRNYPNRIENQYKKVG